MRNKDAFLGMPHGTACGRLRKNVLFHILKKYSENVCYRCNEEIESVDDLSIEHIKPWEGISVDLFWDLSNIAFSHLHCNCRARRSTKIVSKPGLNWCYKHKEFLPVESFAKDLSHWTGLCHICKPCMAAAR